MRQERNEALIDEALAQSFPASDPPAFVQRETRIGGPAAWNSEGSLEDGRARRHRQKGQEA